METGYIKLSRKFFTNDLWNEARTFSSCEAWLDLIQAARFEATPLTVSIGGREVSYSRGQYPASIRYLSKRWQWTERHVRSFLAFLKKQGMITIPPSKNINIITLVNYDLYNPTGDTAFDTASDTINTLNNNKLSPKVTQPVTQRVTQPPKSDTQVTQNKRKINNISTTPHAHTHTRDDGLFAELRDNPVWLDTICMRFSKSSNDIMQRIDEFQLECRCKDHHPGTLSDLRRHFHDWLRINIQKEQKNEQATNHTTDNRKPKNCSTRSKLAPEAECGLIE